MAGIAIINNKVLPIVDGLLVMALAVTNNPVNIPPYPFSLIPAWTVHLPSLPSLLWAAHLPSPPSIPWLRPSLAPLCRHLSLDFHRYTKHHHPMTPSLAHTPSSVPHLGCLPANRAPLPCRFSPFHTVEPLISFLFMPPSLSSPSLFTATSLPSPPFFTMIVPFSSLFDRCQAYFRTLSSSFHNHRDSPLLSSPLLPLSLSSFFFFIAIEPLLSSPFHASHLTDASSLHSRHHLCHR